MNADEPVPAVIAPAPPQKPKKRLLPIILTVLCVLLLAGLVASIVLWRPWQPNIKAGDRTISVTGTATVKSEPDEFVFYPNYTVSNNDKQAALTEITKKSDEIVTKLKALGVASNKIKTDSSGYNSSYIAEPNGDNTYNLTVTVTVTDKDLAQKVQDYLITTSPTGAISPSANFSTAKQNTLEAQARGKAEQDAKAKADQSAKNLGFKVTKVKTVEDNGFDGYSGCGPSGLCAGANVQSAIANDSAASKLSVQPGENDLSYSVKVTYYIR